MEENITYSSFAYLDQYTPTEGEVVYYNVEKTLAAKKNDCSYGTAGNSVTLTAAANKFISKISNTDADKQAEYWLLANAQANANNIGTCGVRAQAWRGDNASCVIESPPTTTTLLPFDYMLIKYKWALGAGQDFDTFTGFVRTGTEWDDKYMGFGHQQGTELPNGSSISDSYIMYAGDNQKDNGVEACFINFKKLSSDYDTLKSIPVRMAGAWYDPVGTGNIDIEITTYSGGTMQKVESEYDFVNVGGTQVQQLIFSKNVPKPPLWVNNIDLVTNIGYIIYNKDNATAKVVMTY